MSSISKSDRSLVTRRGLTFRQRIRAEQSYGLLFGMIIVSLIVSAAVGGSPVGRAFAIVLQGGVLRFALWTSRSGSPRALRWALVLVSIVVAVAAVASAGGSDLAAGVEASTTAELGGAAIGAIVRRLAPHPRVMA